MNYLKAKSKLFLLTPGILQLSLQKQMVFQNPLLQIYMKLEFPL